MGFLWKDMLLYFILIDIVIERNDDDYYRCSLDMINICVVGWVFSICFDKLSVNFVRFIGIVLSLWIYCVSWMIFKKKCYKFGYLKKM